MEEIKLGKAYQRDLVVDKRYPVIRTGEQEDKKYVRGDILDANAVQQLIDNILEEDPKAVVERGAGENSILQKGTGAVATGEAAMAVGLNTKASGAHSFAEGEQTNAIGLNSHAEGGATKASGFCGHAEGYDAKATGPNSHAEGTGSEASNGSAHAEGYQCLASGDCSHAEGYQTVASGHQAHAGGIHSRATAQCSFASGWNLRMNTAAGAAFGKFNTVTTEIGDPLFCVGVGTDENNRKNALSVSETGVEIRNNSEGNDVVLRISGNEGSFQGDWDFSNANVTGLPEGSGAAYEIVDAGMLELKVDGNDPYYEVPVMVYTLLKTVWDEGKVPVLTGELANDTTSFALIPVYNGDSFYCFFHGANGSYHVLGVLYAGQAGRLRRKQEQEPITVDQTVQSGSQNPVSGNAVYLALASLEARVAALENNQ